MSTKLTLTIKDKDIINKMKEFAKEHNRSLSDIVENYFKSVTKSKVEDKEEELPPITKSLKGIFKNVGDFDYKEERMKRLEEKYLK